MLCQTRLISGYDGFSKIVIVNEVWVTTQITRLVFEILPVGAFQTRQIKMMWRMLLGRKRTRVPMTRLVRWAGVSSVQGNITGSGQ